jgi:SAM-dependent methyltransferase
MPDDASQLFEVMETAVGSGQLQRAVLSQPTQKGDAIASRIDIRPVLLQEAPCYQWSRQLGAQIFHENCDPPATVNALKESMGRHYRHVHLVIQDEQWSARYSRRGKCRLIKEKHTNAAAAPEANTDHDRTRQYLLPEGQPVPFLVETGIMTRSGQVRSRHFRKFRQLNRFVEIIADIVDRLPADDVIRIVDFGCGKSYLTFATHYYLTRIAQRQVSITGLDRRSDVVQMCNRIVETLELPGIQFEQGDIAAFEPADQIHLAVSLHACDTATDDAIAQAVHWKTDVVLAVPCCQHELHAASKAGGIPLLSRYGILQERFCALTTDAIRSALLEQAGYQTQVLEFIDMEHTAKNLLIRAVRRSSNTEGSHSAQAVQELARFCDVFQLPELHLQRRLQELQIPLPNCDTAAN